MPAEARTRRNGQPQACEPCRKTKVRCDHGSPKCSRCMIRRLDCIYHPAPMTKSRDSLQSPSPALGYVLTTQTSSGTPISPISTPTAHQHMSVSSPGSEAYSAAIGSTTSSHGQNGEKAKRTTLFQKEGASYGTTRYSAVFSENHASFGPAISEVIDEGEPLNEASSSSNELNRRADVSASRRELAIDTLLNFPTLRTCEILIEGLDYVHDVWISPVMIRQCLTQVWREYGRCLGDDRSRESVSVMANDLFENGKQLSPASGSLGIDDSSWMNWFGGPHLRWEMIGLLFCWAGMAFHHRQEWDGVFELPEQQSRNRNTAAERMRECAVTCSQLCDDFSEINDTIVCLMKNCSKLRSVIISDESDRIRVDYGTVGSAFITAGLHRLPLVEKVTPLSQYRSTISASMYYLDKCESLFNGRPPILDRRYCHCPLPLDLCEEDVYNGPERLAAAIQKLDSNGWNTDGKIYTATWLRATHSLAPIREEILEMSLSVNVQYTKSQVDSLILQVGQTARSYPSHIQYRSDQRWPKGAALFSPNKGAHQMYIITRIQLDVLQGLFDIAHEMITIILSIWSNRDQLQQFHFAFDWLLLSYGIPSAGILCLELLRASNLAPRMRASDSEQPPIPVHISRSDVVQTLTMFMAFLDWIRPTDNNAQIYLRFKKVVKRIIDTAFDAPLPAAQRALSNPPTFFPTPQLQGQTPASLYGQVQQQQQQEARQVNLQPALGLMEGFDPGLIAMDDLDWLNTVDWTQGDWLELSQQNFMH